MPESITATSTRLPVASLCASGRLSRSGAYWSAFICGSCSCASGNRKFGCAPATWFSPATLRIMSGTLVPPSIRQRNSRRPVRRKVRVSMRVIAWRAAIALSWASDTLGGTSRITSLGTNRAPSGGRLNPLRDVVVVVFDLPLLPALGAPAPPPGGGRLTGWIGGGSDGGGSCGSPRSGVGNSRDAMKTPSAARGNATDDVPDDVAVGIGIAGWRSDRGGGGQKFDVHCADALCTPSVNASTNDRNVRKSVRVIN